ncbi:related to OPT1-High-affinity glutathione transporter [Phialocephala subalpina]|uniref:Related to OPT1-High-affinity glutathione transporter n=1 Tax=Phialocephala subalpina TaxID=576137 RepID=A0A1L7WTJ4_9HELO|nr:related to OPT1-High-affinity glutathione transporter [Phialocephala subalpina]
MAGTRLGRRTATMTSMDSASTSSFEKMKSGTSVENLVRYDTWDAERNKEEVVANMETIALKALHVDDDPTLNPWTFRMFFLGFGLSGFGSALATIFLFKPQSVSVSVIFLTVISYVIGNAMSLVIPNKGVIGRWFNPHSFNSKEHLAIVIMSSSASGAAYATEVLATQKLYYNIIPNALVAILLLLSSQLLGYGLAGVLRKSLVYPTKMLWPSILPLSSLIETLHRDKSKMRKKFNFFWIIFSVVAVWELFPQYVMPVLTGISFFCLANRKSLVFTNIFGGASGNEGLGLLALSFDWQYITTSSLFLPLITLTNSFIGFVICTALYIGLYYGNVWQAMNFPFLSQSLFSPSSNSTLFDVYNQSAILDANNALNVAALETAGIPFFATTNAAYLLTTNLGITATVMHIILWNREAVKQAFVGLSLSKIRSYRPNLKFWQKSHANQGREKLDEDTSDLDPHYKMMLAYNEVPALWYIGILAVSMVVALFCIYNLNSTLPWWGFFIACLLSFLSTLFFGALAGLVGFNVPITSVIQLIGGYLHPGKPVANMYFVLFGANAQAQALFLVENLKLGQYGKLSPKCTFTVQIMGTVFGAIVNYVLMNSITTSQRDILLSLEGTNIWSGQVIQSFNSNAIAFGALSKYMFSIGRTYQWIVLALPVGFAVPLPFYFAHRYWPKAGFDYFITPVICWYLGYLSVGINSSVMMYFLIGFFVQFFVRKRYPEWFLKYNYILAAAISGGTELLVFVTTFAVQGASGVAIPFPP